MYTWCNSLSFGLITFLAWSYLGVLYIEVNLMMHWALLVERNESSKDTIPQLVSITSQKYPCLGSRKKLNYSQRALMFNMRP